MNSQIMNIVSLTIHYRVACVLKPALWLALVAALALTVPAQATAQGGAEFHESWNLNAGGTVSVQNVSGYIRVTGWDENRVKVDAVKRPQRRTEDLSRVEIQVSAAADRVEIRTIYPRLERNPDVSVDYDIRVPRSAIGSFTSVSGSISVSGVNARTTARSTSGEITAQSIGGEASLSTTSGNVTASGIKGVLTVRSTSGSLQLSEIGSHLNATSTSGSVRAIGISGDAHVTSTSGNVSIERVGGRAGARSVSGSVDVSDVSGDVEAGSTSDNVTVEKVRGRVMAATVSGRLVARDVQAGVRASTVSGAIEITAVKGGISADSTSGSIVLRDVESDEVRAKSFSGTVRFQGRVSDTGRYIFDSFSGEIVIVLPANTSFNLTARTASGDVESDFPMQLGPGSDLSSVRRKLEATHGRGGAQFNLTGFSASIKIKKQ